MLVPVTLENVCSIAVDRFSKKYPEALLEIVNA